MRFILGVIITWLILNLSGCVSGNVYAPVTEVAAIEPMPKSGIYYVKPHESLYIIAWRYGLDYAHLAKINNLSYPYSIKVGQMLYLRGKAIHLHPTARIVKKAPVTSHVEPNMAVSTWYWPAHGVVISEFSELNKGINIDGPRGEPIYATAAGRVVYNGDGLRAYGNLIIIRHNNTFLSAYAHCEKVLIKEGDWIKSGQKIAEMGDTGSRRVMLHFEIRRNGKPVNPLNYLAKR